MNSMKQNYIGLVGVLILMLLGVACGGADMALEEPMAAPAESRSQASADYDGLVASELGAVEEESEKVVENQAGESTADLPQQRLIIRTGNLSIVVEDTEVALDTITRFANELNGWVVNSNTYRYSSTAMSGEITIRIPAEQYNEVMEGVKGLALEVTSENSWGQDVTEEFVDLSSRLENLEATAARVRGFLDDTQTVEEALQVNVELGRLEGEIELIKGRMKYLSESAAFSTITVHLTPDEANQPIEVAGWQPQGIAKDAIEALIFTLQGLTNLLIWLTLYLLPIGLILGIPLYYLGRWLRRRWLAGRTTAS